MEEVNRLQLAEDALDRSDARYARLLARVRALEAGLAEYGRHKAGCPGRAVPQERSAGWCSCGLAELK